MVKVPDGKQILAPFRIGRGSLGDQAVVGDCGRIDFAGDHGESGGVGPEGTGVRVHQSVCGNFPAAVPAEGDCAVTAQRSVLQSQKIGRAHV